MKAKIWVDCAGETWRPIDGCDGWYEVSSAGRVRSFAPSRGQVDLRSSPCLMGQHEKKGYLTVILKRDGKSWYPTVHSLVLTAFHGPRQEGLCGCHADGDRKNNNVSNLRWDTYVANAADKEAHGRTARGVTSGAVTKPHRIRRGSLNGRAKLTEASAALLRYLHDVHDASCAELAGWFGVSDVAAGLAARRRTWRHV